MAGPLESAGTPPLDPVTSLFRESNLAGYLTSRSQEAALEGLFGAVLEQEQLLVVTGEPGAGKTTVMRKLSRELAGTVAPVFCPATGLDFHQILSFVCADLRLGFEDPKRKSELEALTEHLAGNAPKPVALLIDDADRLQGDALDQLLRLSRAMGRRRARFHLVLSGRPVLQERLTRASASHSGIARAVFARLTRLSNPESTALVERLIAEGRNEGPLSVSSAAIQHLVELGQGLPGSLVALYSAAASSARRRGEAALSVQIVEDAAGAQRAGPLRPSESPGEALVEGPNPTEETPPYVPARPASARWRTAGAAGVALAAIVVAVGVMVHLRQSADGKGGDPVPGSARQSQAQAPPALSPPEPAGTLPVAAAPVSPVAELSRNGEPVTEIRIAAPGNRDDGAPLKLKLTKAGGAMPGAATTGTESAPAKFASAQGNSKTDAPGVITPDFKGGSRSPPTASPSAGGISEALTPTNRAWAAFHRNALTTPLDDNAVKWAEAALAMKPGDEAAMEVLRKVVDTYLGWSNDKFELNRLAAAAKYLDKARFLDHYATPEQLTAIKILEGELEARKRGVCCWVEGPQWLKDLDAWLRRNLPLPLDE